ncbi:hypothetical protein [Jiangella rhizosphaerae]|uniref:Uncharacterized protein n=1 Tax=Jiangella rhizosphaerae TaxID=2293569 RepID=A0A418KPB5_9ACTN|nr:hypothetical protein [Jiangella rhizosphaerae]RIQ21064.1 hypothetical protein DY240_16055 [Jiangella rhizosphaerae]
MTWDGWTDEVTLEQAEHVDLSIEGPEADLLEQQVAVVEEEPPLLGTGLPVESDEADALDQRRVVPWPDEDEALLVGVGGVSATPPRPHAT